MSRRVIIATCLLFASSGALQMLACGSFSADDSTPGPDAADAPSESEAEGGADVNVSEAEAAAPLCTPQPLEPSDAGEDASCGSGGATTNLLVSPTDCGRCGHDCGGGDCNNGLCTSVAIATEAAAPSLGSLVGGRLYYSAVPGRLRSIALDGGAPTTYGEVDAAAGVLNAPIVEGDDIYAIVDDLGVIRASSTIPDSSVTTFYPRTGYQLRGLAVDQGNVFTRDYQNELTARSRSGGSAPKSILVADPSSPLTFTAFVADGPTLYWAVNTAGLPGKTTINARAASGATATKVTDIASIPALAFDADYIYMAGVDGKIWRMAKGLATAPVQIAQLPGMRLYPKGFAVDEDSVYIACTDNGVRDTVDMLLYRAPKCGGPARLIASDSLYGYGLASAGKYLYWTRQGAIARGVK